MGGEIAKSSPEPHHHTKTQKIEIDADSKSQHSITQTEVLFPTLIPKIIPSYQEKKKKYLLLLKTNTLL